MSDVRELRLALHRFAVTRSMEEPLWLKREEKVYLLDALRDGVSRADNDETFNDLLQCAAFVEVPAFTENFMAELIRRQVPRAEHPRLNPKGDPPALPGWQ